MNNSRPKFSSCPAPLLPVCQAKLLRSISFVICDCSQRDTESGSGGIMPLNIHFDSDLPPALAPMVPESTQTGCCRIGISLSLSLSDFTHPELTLGPTVEREQHIKVGIVKIFSIIMTSGSVTWFVTHCHVLRVPCHEWNDLAWLQIET